MEVLLVFILLLISIEFLFDRSLDYLNARNWRSELPEKLSGLIDEKHYQRSKEYFKANYSLGWKISTFNFLLVFLLLYFGFFGFLSDTIVTYTANEIIASLLFFGCLVFGSDLLNLPFSLVKIFVIEEKFGFNKMTARIFIIDKLKSWLLTIVLGSGFLSLLLLFYKYTADNFWWITWILIGVIMIVLSMFYTTVFVPLFNKLVPLSSGSLRTSIEKYCLRVSFPVTDILVMDGSRRSSKANAFFSGFGKRKKIILYDTLIEKHTEEELVAVLAHEVGHYKLKHTRSGLLTALLQTGLMLYVFSLFLGNPVLSMAMGAKMPAVHLEFLALILLYAPVSLISGILTNFLSRKHEYEADAFAKETYSGEALSSALKKLSTHQLSNPDPHPWVVGISYSHPPLVRRLAALKK